jgi:hypothetical protein
LGFDTGKRTRAVYGRYYSREAHFERLNALLNWARTSEEISECIRKGFKTKATRLLKEESKRLFGVGSRLGNEYAEVTYVRLKTQRALYTRWGYLEEPNLSRKEAHS